METTTTSTTDAALMAAAIVGELLAVEEVARDGFNRCDEETRRVAFEGFTAEEIEEADGAVFAWLDFFALDVAVLADTRRNGRTRVEVLLTYGGPRCDLARDSDDGAVVTVTVHSGGDSAAVPVEVPTVAECLDDFSKCHAGFG